MALKCGTCGSPDVAPGFHHVHCLQCGASTKIGTEKAPAKPKG